MHRSPARPVAKAVLSVLVVCLGIASLGSGCVLRHPDNPATPAAIAWGKAHGSQVVELSRTAGGLISPSSRPTSDALIDALTQSCTDLQTQAAAALKLPKIPSPAMQAQWASGVSFMRVAASGCLTSLDVSSTRTALQNNTLRNTASTNAAFGQIRLGAVMSFLQISSRVTTTVATAP